MKKGIFLCVSMIMVVAHAAEQEKSLAMVIGKTSFSIIKGNMYKYHTAVGCMVVGRCEQRQFQEPDLNDWVQVGKIDDKYKEKAVYFLPKNAEKQSDEDQKIYFGIKKDGKFWEQAKKIDLDCSLIRIVEPRITLDPVSYYSSKDHPRRKGTLIYVMLYEDKALEEASKDLAICYKNALEKGLEVLKDKEEKKIALAALSTDLGLEEKKAVPATFKAIIDFIRNDCGYASIQLFVKNDSEFNLYKNLTEEYSVQEK